MSYPRPGTSAAVVHLRGGVICTEIVRRRFRTDGLRAIRSSICLILAERHALSSRTSIFDAATLV